MSKKPLRTAVLSAATIALAGAVLAPGASAATIKPGSACTAKQVGKTSGTLTCTKKGAKYTWQPAPAPAASPTGSLVVIADTVWGPYNLTEAQRKTGSCVNGSRFPHNSQIVWRSRVVDGATGKDLDDKLLKSVELTLSDGQKLPLKFGPHPSTSPTDFFWTTSFKVPEAYPSGTLGYKLVAVANDGRTTTYEPFKVAPSLLTITDDVLPML